MSHRTCPNKNLGGTAETQKDFLDSLNTDPAKRRHVDKAKEPPVANQFALGYTYQDVLDADHEGRFIRGCCCVPKLTGLLQILSHASLYIF
jgi:hypothetical protein